MAFCAEKIPELPAESVKVPLSTLPESEPWIEPIAPLPDPPVALVPVVVPLEPPVVVTPLVVPLEDVEVGAVPQLRHALPHARLAWSIVA